MGKLDKFELSDDATTATHKTLAHELSGAVWGFICVSPSFSKGTVWLALQECGWAIFRKSNHWFRSCGCIGKCQVKIFWGWLIALWREIFKSKKIKNEMFNAMESFLFFMSDQNENLAVCMWERGVSVYVYSYWLRVECHVWVRVYACVYECSCPARVWVFKCTFVSPIVYCN